MKHLRWIARFVSVIILCFSLIFTGLSFVGGAAITAVSQALFAMTGVRTQVLQQADDLASLRKQLGDTKAAKAKVDDELIESKAAQKRLRGELAESADELGRANKRISGLSTELSDEKTQRLAAEKLEREARQELVSKTDDVVRLERNLKGATAELAAERAQRQAVEAAEREVRKKLDDATLMVRIAKRNALATIIDTADGTMTIKAAMKQARSRMADKTEKMARRGVTGMAAEAVPYFGTAAIVGLTALDIKDLCEMARSSNELYFSIFEEERPTEDDPTVCSISVPTRTELWEMAKKAPGQAFTATKEALPELEDIRQIDSSDVWSFGLSAVESAAKLYEGTKTTAKLTWGTLADLWRDWNR